MPPAPPSLPSPPTCSASILLTGLSPPQPQARAVAFICQTSLPPQVPAYGVIDQWSPLNVLLKPPDRTGIHSHVYNVTPSHRYSQISPTKEAIHNII